MAKVYDDIKRCRVCGQEGRSFQIGRADGFHYLCPEHFFDYLPNYHQKAITRTVLQREKIKELREPFA